MTNKTALQFIKYKEGCKLEAYQDQAGVWTIGYGHTGPEVGAGLIWTQEQADAAVIERVDDAALAVKKLVTVSLNENQEASLISFVYNLGAGRLQGSTLLKILNSGLSIINVAKEFQKWDYVAGVENKGLLKRRFEEAIMFLS